MALPNDANRLTSVSGVQGSLNALYKVVYADKLENVKPEGTCLQKDVKFISKDKQIGEKFVVPIILGYEHGVTFADSMEDAFALNEAVPGTIKQAEVRANPMVLRSMLGYAAASRAATSEGAFQDATKYVMANMVESVAYKLEIVLWHGQTNIGVVETVTGATVEVSEESWADFVFAGAEGMKVSLFTGTTLDVTKTVLAVDMETRILTLDSSSGLAVGQTLHMFGSRVAGGAYKEAKGLVSIISESSSLFGISLTGAGASSLFKGNTYNVGGVISFNKINAGLTKAVAKGLKKNVKVYVPFKAWDQLMTDQAALRDYDGSYNPKQGENGFQAIRYHSKNGLIEIIPCGYLKNGHAVAICTEDYLRVGSSDISFKIPGDNENYFRHLEGHAAYEMRAWSDQALFGMRPGYSVLFTGITY